MKTTLAPRMLAGAAASSILVAFSLAGCASTAAGDADETSSQVEVNPSGGDGKILVKAAGSIAPSQVFAQRTGAAGPTTPFELVPNVPGPAFPGRYCVWTVVRGIATPANCDVVVNSAATTGVPLGTVKYTKSSDDLIFGVDWPSSAKLGGLVNQGMVPHVSGKVTTGIAPFAISYEVRTHDITSVDLSALGGRHTLRILPSTNRTLPSSTLTSTSVGYGLFMFKGILDERPLTTDRLDHLLGKEDRALVVRSADPVKLQLGYTRCWVNEYGTRCSNPRTDVVPQLTAPSETVRFGRLDVNKVKFTKHDGSVVMVDGTYDVLFENTPVLKGFALGTGVDVLPSDRIGGAYTVVVSYVSPEDGSPLTFREDVVVTP